MPKAQHRVIRLRRKWYLISLGAASVFDPSLLRKRPITKALATMDLGQSSPALAIHKVVVQIGTAEADNQDDGTVDSTPEP